MRSGTNKSYARTGGWESKLRGLGKSGIIERVGEEPPCMQGTHKSGERPSHVCDNIVPEKFASIMEEPSNGSKPTEYVGPSSFVASVLTSVSTGVSSDAAMLNTNESRIERKTALSHAMSRCSCSSPEELTLPA